jgi:hypothetical protein
VVDFCGETGVFSKIHGSRLEDQEKDETIGR